MTDIRPDLEELPGLVERLRARQIIKNGPHDSLCSEAADKLERLAAEVTELRRIVSELGYCTPDASLEFMAMIPAEVARTRKPLEDRRG
jgi:hypothetical protein